VQKGSRSSTGCPQEVQKAIRDYTISPDENYSVSGEGCLPGANQEGTRLLPMYRRYFGERIQSILCIPPSYNRLGAFTGSKSSLSLFTGTNGYHEPKNRSPVLSLTRPDGFQRGLMKTTWLFVIGVFYCNYSSPHPGRMDLLVWLQHFLTIA